MAACSDNGFLVEEIDHFCPWTGTTIAKKNLPFFHTFLCMLMAGLIYSMLVVAMAMGSAGSLHLRGSWRNGAQVGLGLGLDLGLVLVLASGSVSQVRATSLAATDGWWPPRE